MSDQIIPDFIEQDADLRPLTTFGIPARARYLAHYSSLRELERIVRTDIYRDNEVLHIGGGSNLLFVNDFDGLILHSRITGCTRYEKDGDHVFAIVGAGENWDSFVDWTIAEGLAGVENLAGIPGEAGASAVQNVGAYGVEAADVIHAVECYDTHTGKVVTLKNEECCFGYRDSIFKNDARGRYFVLRVAFRLLPSTEATHLDYGPLRDFAERLGHTPGTAEVAAEVRRIRSEKLPDPRVTGSAGSFFKNPVVSRYCYTEQLLGINPGLPHYDVNEQFVKIPAGWLIEHAGMKGHRVGGAEVYPRQCLVIANTGTATAADVTTLAEEVRRAVKERFGVTLEPEVNYIDTSIRATILGSGTSKGIPEVNCRCRVCTSQDRRDTRLRASVLVKTHGLNLMIDASPDFRAQALAAGISELDAVLFTHSHYDHVGGIDDLRPFCASRDLPLYVREDVNDDLHRRLDYCFREHPYPGVPVFDMRVIDDRPFFVKGLKVVPVNVMHGKLPIFGYRIGDFAYITDAKTIDPDEREKLRGLKVLVINALRQRDHFAHLTIEEALELIADLKPERAYLTHLCHEAGLHAELEKQLPPGVFPCYDGLTIKC